MNNRHRLPFYLLRARDGSRSGDEAGNPFFNYLAIGKRKSAL
jgi:hypothetical protein